MTYKEIEYAFMQCIDKGIVVIRFNEHNSIVSYHCAYPCHDSMVKPKCPIKPNIDRLCRHDAQYNKKLLAKAYQTHPELFI